MNRTLILHEFDNNLTKGLVAVLRQGAALIARLDDALYTADGRGSVGGHFRHCLDFVNSFLAGAKTGEIDYHTRRRDGRIEQNRQYAIEQIESAVAKLRAVPVLEMEKTVEVKLETSETWCQSSLLRELEYVQSHTTHHYALIAFKLAQKGLQVEAEFGVAPSTLEFWKKENSSESRLQAVSVEKAA